MSKENYDTGMLKDFIEHLLWELRIAVFENKGDGRINPELAEQLAKYIKRRKTAGLLTAYSMKDDLGDAAGLKAQRDMKKMRAAERERALRALEALIPTLEEALECARHPKEFLVKNHLASEVEGLKKAAQEKAPYIVEGVLEPKFVDTEDSGAAMIGNLDEVENGTDNGMFVRLHSWDEAKVHEEFKRFIGKRVRVTVEIVG